MCNLALFVSVFKLWRLFSSLLLIIGISKETSQFVNTEADSFPSSDSLQGSSSKNDTINFYLYNATAPTLSEQLVLMNPDGSIPKNGLWKKNGALKVIIHGYHIMYAYSNLDHIDDHRMPRIAEEYAKLNDSLNIILVDWSSLAIRVNYAKAVRNVKVVGQVVAQFLIDIYNNAGFHEWFLVHVIGFSLGSHVSGAVGYEVQLLSKDEYKIGRITGLDPAGPLFDVNGEEMPKDTTGFLDRSDADFVDILHCNMGGLPHWSVALHDGRLGSFVPAGHADFYPNGGITQPYQCTDEDNKAKSCSHRCCVAYYVMSISRPILACPCKSWKDFNRCKCNNETGIYMGDPISTRAAGKYFLRITDKIPMSELKKEEHKSIKGEESANSVANRVHKVVSNDHEMSSNQGKSSDKNNVKQHVDQSGKIASSGLNETSKLQPKNGPKIETSKLASEQYSKSIPGSSYQANGFNIIKRRRKRKIGDR